MYCRGEGAVGGDQAIQSNNSDRHAKRQLGGCTKECVVSRASGLRCTSDHMHEREKACTLHTWQRFDRRQRGTPVLCLQPKTAQQLTTCILRCIALFKTLDSR